MKRSIWNIVLIFAGAAMAAQWSETLALLKPYSLPLGIALGWAARGIINETVSQLGSKIIASAYGKKATLGLLAKGIAKMGTPQ